VPTRVTTTVIALNPGSHSAPSELLDVVAAAVEQPATSCEHAGLVPHQHDEDVMGDGHYDYRPPSPATGRLRSRPLDARRQPSVHLLARAVEGVYHQILMKMRSDPLRLVVLVSPAPGRASTLKLEAAHASAHFTQSGNRRQYTSDSLVGKKTLQENR